MRHNQQHDRSLESTPIEGSTQAWQHEPVLLAEVLDHLTPALGGHRQGTSRVLLDGTLGMGGHFLPLLDRLQPGDLAIGLDRDPQALATVRGRLADRPSEAPQPDVRLVQASFRQLAEVAAEHALDGLDAVLLDLGLSTDQLTSPRFSFRTPDAPLDMRLDPEAPETAADLVHRLTADELEHVLREYGEERFARRIAGAIVEQRRRQPIATVGELVDVIRRALPANARHGRLHLATRTFQALRIAVNDELAALAEVLAVAPPLLRPGGRMVVLAYHSLEDRLVKHTFRALAQDQNFTVITRRPLVADQAEVERNPNARSAKLRVLTADAPASAGDTRASRDTAPDDVR